MESSEFISNECDDAGGAVHITGASTVTILTCFFSSNRATAGAGRGGAVHVSDASAVEMRNNDLVGNEAFFGAHLSASDPERFLVSGRLRIVFAASHRSPTLPRFLCRRSSMALPLRRFTTQHSSPVKLGHLASGKMLNADAKSIRAIWGTRVHIVATGTCCSAPNARLHQ